MIKTLATVTLLGENLTCIDKILVKVKNNYYICSKAMDYLDITCFPNAHIELTKITPDEYYDLISNEQQTLDSTTETVVMFDNVKERYQKEMLLYSKSTIRYFFIKPNISHTKSLAIKTILLIVNMILLISSPECFFLEIPLVFAYIVYKKITVDDINNKRICNEFIKTSNY